MESMTGWDIVLFVVAGYVAVMSVTRLMIRRRDQLLVELRRQMKAERERKQTEAAKQALVAEAERQREAA